MLGVLACLLVAASGASAAQQRFEIHERRLELLVRFEQQGYEGSITTKGHKQVTLLLRKGKSEIEARTSGRVTQHGIEASFGELGRVSLRFEGERVQGSGKYPFFLGRSGESGGVHPCRGREPVLEKGIFEGMFEFGGKEGLPHLIAKRVSGMVQRRYRRVCPAGGRDLAAAFQAQLGKMQITSLRAQGRIGEAKVIFEANAIDLRPVLGRGLGVLYSFWARTVEQRGGVRLTRGVRDQGEEGSFLFSGKGPKAQSATVTPKQPFTGSAEYRKEPGSPASWSGTLTASIPNLGLVPVAGPGFRARLCRFTYRALIDNGKCLPEPDRRPQLLSELSALAIQGSGSQSQAFWDVRLSWSR